jgi:hypothetical protein
MPEPINVRISFYSTVRGINSQHVKRNHKQRRALDLFNRPHKVDKLWCPPNEDRRTLEQVALQNVEGAPSELSKEELEQYASFLMSSDSDIDV